ncbi:hypothetical protein Tcan_01689 [Toxocara canis]|uniref:Uncharacterized protein n=1 Tax=Toxocara canis TaxID=6265 RepID=A0A0B2VE06_TOXCA|nr:hypothetical protein Tcan_01689 [Toxocara canis]
MSESIVMTSSVGLSSLMTVTHQITCLPFSAMVNEPAKCLLLSKVSHTFTSVKSNARCCMHFADRHLRIAKLAQLSLTLTFVSICNDDGYSHLSAINIRKISLMLVVHPFDRCSFFYWQSLWS